MGTPFHLLCDDFGEYHKAEQEPTDTLSVKSKDIWLYSKLYGFDLPYFPPKRYVDSIGQVLEYEEKVIHNIPWHHIMPFDIYKEELKKYTGFFKQHLSNIKPDYVDNVYKQQNILFDSLKPAKINTEKFLENLEKNFGDGDAIKTFVPENGYTSKIYYDRLNTITGRLTVYKGPNILTLKREYRHMLESRFGDKGKIYYLDYSSLEPRLLLSTTNKKDIPQDIYQHVINELDINDKNITREAIKQVILTKIYGGSDDLIKHNLKSSSNIRHPEDIIKLVTIYFNIEDLKKKLSEEYYSNNGSHIMNAYDKPVLCPDTQPYKLINYYIQSTGVDVAMLGFTNIINKINLLEELHNHIIPVFLLHDAILFDIHNDYEKYVDKVCKAGSKKIYKFEDIDFYLKNEESW